MPLIIYEEFVIGIFSALAAELAVNPESFAPAATVKTPVPREPNLELAAFVRIFISPSSIVTAPEDVHMLVAPTVMIPLPILTNLSEATTPPLKVKSSSLPTCHVLIPVEPSFENVQYPPNEPLPVNLPIRSVFALFWTMIPEGIFRVKESEPFAVSNVKRPSSAYTA